MTTTAQNSKQFLGQQGSATVPSFSFLGAGTNGFYLSGTNKVSITTNGTQAVTVDATQQVGIGNATPAAKLDVAGTTIISTNSSSDALRITQTGAGNAILVEDSANPDSTPFVVDTDGRILTGTTTASVAISGLTPQVQTQGIASARVQEGIYSWSSNVANPPGKLFLRSKSNTVGTRGVVTLDDPLGTLIFAGDDGTAFIEAANITARVDGTPGTNDMPGRLVFSTTADGASSATERMRIGSSGQIGIAGANYGTSGQVLTSGGPSAAPSWTTLSTGVTTLAAGTNISVSGSTGAVTVSTIANPTFATSITSPIHLGGTAASSSLTLQSTSGVGTTDSIVMKVGNNGATTALSIATGGQITVGAGSLSAPVIAPTGDTNTGIFFPAADTIAFAEGGAEVLRLNSDAQVVTGAGTVSLPAVTATGDLNTGIFYPAADTVAVTTGGTERLRVASAGQIGIAGANYGTSGQVLTSGGSGAAPSWATPSGTATGTVIGYGSSSPPSGFLACDGSTYNDASYTALSTVLGNIRSNVFTNNFSSTLSSGDNTAVANSRIFLLRSDNSGASYFSADSGATWSSTTSSLGGNVVWTGTNYVAGHSADCSGSLGIRYSSNATSWTQVTTNINWTVSGIAWSGSRLVAVGQNIANNAYSTNSGVNWTAGGAIGFNTIDVAFGAGLFVAVGISGSAGRISTSTDGTSWTTRTVPTGFATSVGIKSVSFVNSRFVAVDSNCNIASSTDGITWTLNFSTGNRIASPFVTTTTGDRNRVAYSTSDSSYYVLDCYSTNLASWTRVPRAANYGTAITGSLNMNAVSSDGTRVYNSAGTVYNPIPYTTGTQFLVPNLQTVNSAGVFYHIKT